MESFVLVTGGTGFVGIHLVKSLIKRGLKVIVVGRTRKKLLSKNLLYIQGDVSSWKFVDGLFKKYNFDICFHLAGSASVDFGYKTPHETLMNNIDSAINILEATRIYGTRRLIIASTSQVYGNNEQIPFKEYYTPRPSRIYETSKTCVDIIAQSYRISYDVPVFIARFTNIYGPGDLNFSRIVPKTLRFILHNESPQIWGGDAMREYLYIDDVVDAYILLMKADIRKMKNHIFNFGTGSIISVNDLVSKILYYSNIDIAVTHITDGRQNEITIQRMSSKKAATILKWQAKIGLEKGLKKTISWYRNYFKK